MIFFTRLKRHKIQKYWITFFWQYANLFWNKMTVHLNIDSLSNYHLIILGLFPWLPRDSTTSGISC
jgi:hypothetical protein